MNPIKPNYWQHQELQKKFERQHAIAKWSLRVAYALIVLATIILWRSA